MKERINPTNSRHVHGICPGCMEELYPESNKKKKMRTMKEE